LNLLQDFDTFRQIDDFSDLSSEDLNILNGKISKINLHKEAITKMVNDVLAESQNFIKRNRLKESYKQKCFKDSWKIFFIKLISAYSKDKYNNEFIIKKDDFRWNHLEFFLSVWDEYFMNFDLKSGSKFQNNDWHDLFNLVYVQPEFKYWTSEKKRWARIIFENEKLRAYCYHYDM
jgi:hypothetical protein